MTLPLLCLTAPNKGALTFEGTNSYLIGEDEVLIVDAGPHDARHMANITKALRGRRCIGLIATHTHRDHTDAMPALAKQLNAPILGPAPHRLYRELHEGEVQGHAKAADTAHTPNETLQDGAVLSIGGVKLEIVATPGHTLNHICIALPEHDAVLCGDHVMGWSSTVIAPPDGHMGDYMASLNKLLTRPENRYFAGHGAMMENGKQRTLDLIKQRGEREAQLLSLVQNLDQEMNYVSLSKMLYGPRKGPIAQAAALSTLAHLEHLYEQGKINQSGLMFSPLS